MQHRKKLNLILDIDNTLLSAEESKSFDFDNESNKQKNFKHHNMDNYYIVFERPYVQEFLDFVFTHFNISIWTAASKSYALYIINEVILKGHPDRKNKIEYIFYSYHCDLSMDEKTGSKVLSMLWDKYKLPGYTKENTFIMDDYDEVYEYNQHNCILVDPFNYYDEDSVNDTYLKDIIKNLQKLKPGNNFLLTAGFVQEPIDNDDAGTNVTDVTDNDTNHSERGGNDKSEIIDAPKSMNINI